MLKINLYTGQWVCVTSQSNAVSEPACSSVTSSDSSRPQERALAQSDTDGLSGSPQSGAREARMGFRVSSEGSLEPSRLNSAPKPGLGICCCLLPFNPVSSFDS